MTQIRTIGNIVREVRTDSCAEHGAFESTRFTGGGADYWTKCLACAERNHKARELGRAEEERRDLVVRRLASAGIPPKFANARVADGVPDAVTEWLWLFLAGQAKGPLIIVGPVGTGKTHAAVATLRHIISEGIGGCYITTSAYGRSVRSTWTKNASNTTESQLLNQYAHAGFLVLDELGASRDVDAPLIQDLIAARYELGAMRSTIFVSNFAPAKFAEVIGARAADRIREGSALVTVTGKSRRTPSTIAS